MQKTLTVSIAGYNMGRYIEQALDSLTDPRVVDELEVFVIDDGGSDKTLDIAARYAKQYPGTFFPVHKENGGYGTTVNYGIAHATGRYFKLLDGDDWFDREGLFSLVQALHVSEADVVLTNIYRGPLPAELEKSEVQLARRDMTDVGELSANDSFGMHAITYRTELLRRSGLCLPGAMLYTDSIYALLPLEKASAILVLNEYVYCYRVGRSGQSMSREQLVRHSADMFAMSDILVDFCLKCKAEGLRIYDFAAQRSAQVGYSTAIKSLLLRPITKDTLETIKARERQMQERSQDIYDRALACGKTGKLLRVLRMTNYRAYWLFKFIPGGIPY